MKYTTTDEFIDPPQVWYIWDGERLYLPYPGGYSTGGREVCDNIIAANPGKGYQAVQMEVTFAEEGHECIWVGAGFHPDYGPISECAICGDKTP